MGTQRRGPPCSAPQAMRGWGSFLSGRMRPALNSNPTGRPQKASCGSSTRTVSHSPYGGDSTLSVYTGGHPGLGEPRPGQLVPRAPGQAPCTTSEARFPDISLPLPFWGGPASPFLRLASPWLLPGPIQKENGKCLISIWALTKWNFPSVMEVMSALGQARRDAQAHVLTAGHRAGCQPPEAAGT